MVGKNSLVERIQQILHHNLIFDWILQLSKYQVYSNRVEFQIQLDQNIRYCNIHIRNRFSPDPNKEWLVWLVCCSRIVKP